MYFSLHQYYKFLFQTVKGWLVIMNSKGEHLLSSSKSKQSLKQNQSLLKGDIKTSLGLGVIICFVPCLFIEPLFIYFPP